MSMVDHLTLNLLRKAKEKLTKNQRNIMEPEQQVRLEIFKSYLMTHPEKSEFQLLEFLESPLMAKMVKSILEGPPAKMAVRP